MMHRRDFGGAIWAFFSYQVFSDTIRGTFRLATTRMGGFLLGLLILSNVWWTLGPEAKRPDSAQRAVADTACAQIVRELPHDRGVYKVAVLPFERDYTSYVTDVVRDGLKRTGHYNIKDKGVIEKLRKKLRLDPGEVWGAESALKRGRRLKVDAVVFGSVPEFIQDSGRAGIAVHAVMLRVPGGETMAEVTVREGLSKSLASPGYIEAQLHNTSLMARITSWALICLLLPICFSFVVRRITALQSNFYNFFLLAGFVMLNLALAVIIMGVRLTTWWGWLTILVLIVLSSIYNYGLCNRIEELDR